MKKITRFYGDYGFLNNFYESPITMPFSKIEREEVIFPTAEHVYQVTKCAKKEDIEKIIDCCKTAAAAHTIGQKVERKKNWNDIKLASMCATLSFKFEQNKDLAEKLRVTKEYYLVNENDYGDTFWGVCNGIGHNFLGYSLMLVRSTLFLVDVEDLQ